MRLLLHHGWGFDARLWEPLRAALPGIEAAAVDRGYFGDRVEAPGGGGPWLAVGHSLGAAMLLADPPPGCVGLVAINGFDRFTGEGATPERVLERMQTRFEEAPDEVLTAFRARCGAPPAPVIVDHGRLAADLALLAAIDLRGRRAPFPILSLQGAADPILRPDLRAEAFAGATIVQHPQAGHLLPLTHAEWCADRIRAFAGVAA
ncbi:MAG TPA: alpha/beta hydrolase [Sphingomonas sp.]|nr:alpha/beta hydrolase [Sphingomonas sp.]